MCSRDFATMQNTAPAELAKMQHRHDCFSKRDVAHALAEMQREVLDVQSRDFAKMQIIVSSGFANMQHMHFPESRGSNGRQ